MFAGLSECAGSGERKERACGWVAESDFCSMQVQAQGRRASVQKVSDYRMAKPEDVGGVNAELMGAAGKRMENYVNASVSVFGNNLVNRVGWLSLGLVHFLPWPFVVIRTQRETDPAFVAGLERLSFSGMR